MTRITIEALCPAEQIEGANILSAILGETGPAELNTFRVGYTIGETAYAWVGVQVMPYWWTNPDWESAGVGESAARSRPGVVEMIAMRDQGIPIGALCQRPAWDEDEELNMDAAHAAFASIVLLDQIPDEPSEPPTGLVLFRGHGLRSAFNLTPIE